MAAPCRRARVLARARRTRPRRSDGRPRAARRARLMAPRARRARRARRRAARTWRRRALGRSWRSCRNGGDWSRAGAGARMAMAPGARGLARGRLRAAQGAAAARGATERPRHVPSARRGAAPRAPSRRGPSRPVRRCACVHDSTNSRPPLSPPPVQSGHVASLTPY